MNKPKVVTFVKGQTELKLFKGQKAEKKHCQMLWKAGKRKRKKIKRIGKFKKRPQIGTLIIFNSLGLLRRAKAIDICSTSILGPEGQF